MSDELNDVRAQLQTSELFSPGVLAQIDALRASVHEQLRARGIDPTSENEEFELTWMVAGGTLAQLLASKETMDMLSNIADDEQRAAIAAHLLWASGISPHAAQSMSQ